MIRKMGIGMKLSICVGGMAALLFAGMIAFFAVKLRDEAKARVYDAVKMEAEAQASVIDAEIEVALDTARTLAQLLGVMDDMPPMDRRARVNGMLKTLVDGNADFLGVWAVYEPNALDGMDGEYAVSGQGNDAKGRFVPYWNRVGGVHLEPCADYEAPGKGDYYHKPLSSGQEVIMDPVVYKVNNVDTLLISLCVPIRSKGKIVGVAGVDIDVKRLQGLVGKINPFNAGYAFLLSNNGTYVAHPKAEYIGKHILDVRKDATARAEAVKKGQSRTEEQVSLATGETSYYYLSPIRVGQTASPWSIVLTVSLDKLLAHSREVARLSIVAGGVGIAALLGLVILLSRFIVTRPLAGIVEAARHFAAGDFSRRLDVKSGDEVGQAAENLNAAFDIVVDKAWWYESILDSIPFPVSVTDRDMRWTFINKPAEGVIGKTREQVMGRDCRDWGADICGTDRCGVACLKRGQKETTFTQPGLDRDFKVDSAFLDNKKGERIGHIEVVQDVTEANALRKKAESASREGMLAAAGKLEGIVERITASSEELSAQVEEISKGADMQKERMSETATAMEEMNATVMEVAKNAGQAADGAERAKAKAMVGAGIVTEATASIGEVRTKAQAMAVNLGELGRQAESIGQVMNVINDIADQTNLLALNAAIEAARAGDAGRGFAVVADEVRKLAEKTMGATKEVGDNIRAIQEATRKNIADMQAAAAVVDRATELSGQSGGALSEIVSFVETSADQVRGIASAAEEQSAASEEISRSLDEVNRVAGETADSMEQSAQALTELAHMAAELRRLIEELKGDDSGPRGLPA